MCNQAEHSPKLALEGRVVEIFEEDGHRRIRLALQPQAIVDLSDESLADVRLGDTLALEADVMALERKVVHSHDDDHAHVHRHPHLHPHGHSHFHGQPRRRQ